MDLQALDLPGKDREAMTSEALPESITPESLTLALRRSGILGEGRVSAVEAENARSTILSRIVRVRLAYEGEAAGAPPALLFKTGLPEHLQGRRRNASGYLASVFRGGVGPQDERLAAPSRRPRGFA